MGKGKGLCLRKQVGNKMIKRIITYLYMRFVYFPEMKKRVEKTYPEINLRYVSSTQNPLIVQAQRERQWIADDQLH